MFLSGCYDNTSIPIYPKDLHKTNNNFGVFVWLIIVLYFRMYDENESNRNYNEIKKGK